MKHNGLHFADDIFNWIISKKGLYFEWRARILVWHWESGIDGYYTTSLMVLRFKTPYEFKYHVKMLSEKGKSVKKNLGVRACIH